MHVLVLPTWFPTEAQPGAGVFVWEQARLLAQRGVRVGVCFPEQRGLRSLSREALRSQRGQTIWEEREGVAILRRRSWNLAGPTRLSLYAWRREAHDLVRRYVQERGRPDLVHAHCAVHAGCAAASLDCPFVVTEHFDAYMTGRLLGWQRTPARKAFAAARHVLAVSPALRSALAYGDFAADVLVIPNVVDARRFFPPETSLEAPFRWLAVLDLTHAKGADVLLDAFARLPGDARLDVIGAGPLRGTMEREIASLGLGDRVRLVGQRTHSEVAEAMREAHALVHPSRFETFGVVLAEALMSGLPVVATRCGGPEHIVTPAVGRLVPVGDAGAMAAAMRHVQQHREAFEADDLRRRALDRFGPDAVCEKLLDIYREVV